jgi:hypothetical protein
MDVNAGEQSLALRGTTSIAARSVSVQQAAREDAEADDLRCDVNMLNSKQMQLLNLQVQTAQYQ